MGADPRSGPDVDSGRKFPTAGVFCEHAHVNESGEVIGSRWPRGEKSHSHSQLSEMLLRSARFQARRALTQFLSDDDDERLDAAASTGNALELMAKALLASIEAGLLADRGDLDSVLRFADKGALQT